jgi:hypothetical protein
MSALGHRDWRRWAAVAGCVVAAVFVAACGTDEATDGSGSAPQAPVGGSGSELFPGSTLRDWVSYADHIAVLRVVDERALPLGAEEKASGEGLAGREVVLHVERRLWSAENAPPLPDEIRMTGLGWVLHDGKRHPVQSADAPRVMPGERYLAPLALVEFDAGPEWWPLTAGAQMPVEGGVVTPARWNRGISAALAGRSVGQAERAIHTARPDPVAAGLSHMRPQDRVQAVARRKSQGEPEPTGP